MPSPLVFVVYWTPVTSFTATISASTMAALAGSDTDPLMIPLGDWASKGKVLSATHAKKQRIRGKRINRLSSEKQNFRHSSVNSQDVPSRLHVIPNSKGKLTIGIC